MELKHLQVTTQLCVVCQFAFPPQDFRHLLRTCSNVRTQLFGHRDSFLLGLGFRLRLTPSHPRSTISTAGGVEALELHLWRYHLLPWDEHLAKLMGPAGVW